MLDYTVLYIDVVFFILEAPWCRSMSIGRTKCWSLCCIAALSAFTMSDGHYSQIQIRFSDSDSDRGESLRQAHPHIIYIYIKKSMFTEISKFDIKF